MVRGIIARAKKASDTEVMQRTQLERILALAQRLVARDPKYAAVLSLARHSLQAFRDSRFGDPKKLLKELSYQTTKTTMLS